MSSSNCRALNSPYVTLMFTVVTDVLSGTTKQYTVELDMQQFQVPWQHDAECFINMFAVHRTSQHN